MKKDKNNENKKILLIGQDHSTHLKLYKSELDNFKLVEKNGMYTIHYELFNKISDFNIIITFYDLGVYKLKENAEKVLKCLEIAFELRFKVFMFPSDNDFYIQSCEELFMLKRKSMEVIQVSKCFWYCPNCYNIVHHVDNYCRVCGCNLRLGDNNE